MVGILIEYNNNEFWSKVACISFLIVFSACKLPFLRVMQQSNEPKVYNDINITKTEKFWTLIHLILTSKDEFWVTEA